MGVVLYELLKGKKPYSADTPAAVAILQATEPLSKPSYLVNNIPEDGEKVLFKAPTNDPEDRYESMTIFKKAIERVIAEPNGKSVKEETEPFHSISD